MVSKLLSPAKTVIAVPARLTPEECWAEVTGPAGVAGAAKAGIVVARASRARRHQCVQQEE